MSLSQNSKILADDVKGAIKGITRSGTTFTYTCLDGTTGTFTQQDNNTTYSAGTGISISSNKISNTGVTSVNGSTGAVTVNASIPVGIVVAYAANATPSGGFLLCNGGAVSRTTYSALFSVIGTTYGAGDGSTTFALPNLTDKFIQGSGTAGTSKSAGLPNITGYLQPSDGRGGSYGGAFYSTSYSGWREKGTEGTDYTWNFDASRSNSIYGSSTTVQPPALTMRFYIKY